MAERFYLMPCVQGLGSRTRWGLKYLSDGTTRYAWEDRTPAVNPAGERRMLRPGYDRRWVIGNFTDISDAEHAVLEAQPDVWAFPEDLSRPVSGAVRNTVDALLELVDFPAVTNGSYQDLLDSILDVFTVLQRFSGRHTSVAAGEQKLTHAGGRRLDQALTATEKNRVNAAAAEFGMLLPGTASTLREHLEAVQSIQRARRGG